MSTKVSALKRAVKALKEAIEPEPRQYGLRSKPFVCPLCGHDRFTFRNDRSITGLYLLACADYSRVEFFVKPPPVL
jgi:hypothetical protein